MNRKFFVMTNTDFAVMDVDRLTNLFNVGIIQNKDISDVNIVELDSRVDAVTAKIITGITGDYEIPIDKKPINTLNQILEKYEIGKFYSYS